MDRKVEYKAWDKIDKEMFVPYLICLGDKCTKRLKYLEFTRKLDKNKKKIHEGDIVRGEEVRYVCECHEDCDCDKQKIYRVGVVCWNNEEWGWDILNKFGEYPKEASKVGIYLPYGVEIIGNVFKNPEMLNENGVVKWID